MFGSLSPSARARDPIDGVHHECVRRRDPKFQERVVARGSLSESRRNYGKADLRIAREAVRNRSEQFCPEDLRIGIRVARSPPRNTLNRVASDSLTAGPSRRNGPDSDALS